MIKRLFLIALFALGSFSIMNVSAEDGEKNCPAKEKKEGCPPCSPAEE